MAQAPIQGFAIGDRAWFADGRSGLVTQAIFNPNFNEFAYAVEGIGEFFLESFLFHVNPIVDAPPLPPPPPPPPPSVGLSVEQIQAMIDASVGAAIPGLLAAINAVGARVDQLAVTDLDVRFEAVSNSIIRNVAQLSEIQNRLDSADQAADETGEGGTPGFLRRVAGFIGAPFTSLFDAVGAWFLGEVRDGLNR